MSNNSIIIYGNIASGKSSVCRQLAELLPDHRHVCLDDHRIKCWEENPSLGAGQRDLVAQRNCLQDLHGKLIYETTGVTRFFRQAKKVLDAAGQRLIYIHLDCPPHLCIRRYQGRLSRGHIQAPFAWGNYSIEQSIYYFHEKQMELTPVIRINTSKVRPADAAHFISEWLRKQ